LDTADVIIGAEDEEEGNNNTQSQGESAAQKAELWDMTRPLEGDCELEFCTFEEKEGKTVFWHSSAHILGSAIENAYGGKLGIGPPLEEGFYYDFFMGKLSIEKLTDYKLIEDTAKQITQANHPYQRLTLSKEEALRLFQDNPFKVQLISNKIPENGKTTAYRCGNLIDLCMGPHLISTGVVKSFKVTKNSSCYWLGNAKNDTLQRVYAITYPSEKEMKEWIKRKEEEEKRDHRNIGTQQDLFMFHNLSPGSAFFSAHGAFIYNKLVSFIRKEYIIRGFTEVISPNIYNLRLWKTSGHYKNYKDNMFMLKIENQGFGLKPMNCPGHCLMFDSKARSYKELPIRYADFGVLHRNEVSGALSGLTRVRRFQQDDAHIFCAPEQITQEILGQLEFLSHVYNIFGFEYELFLSTRPEKALGDHKLWDVAEKQLADGLDKFGKPWKINPGDGAFYGPKIDIKLYDALKRQHQCGTIQLDFQLPIRFNLSYRTDEQVPTKTDEEEKGKDKKKKDKKEKTKPAESEKVETKEVKETSETVACEKEIYPKDEYDEEEYVWQEQPLRPGYKRPVIVHRAILGSCERLLAILVEHYAGKWPFWISPRQAYICTVSDKFNEYAEKVHALLTYEGYQVNLDKGGLTLPKKVRNAQVEQYNYILVVGEEEMNTATVDVRSREGDRLGKFTVSKLVEFFKSLEPAKSKLELNILEKIYSQESKNTVNPLLEPSTADDEKSGCCCSHQSEFDVLEQRLKYSLYISGDDHGEEDKKTYENLKEADISKEQYPHIFKWKKLMAKTQ
jgi:threonyl-tRNA synthetase